MQDDQIKEILTYRKVLNCIEKYYKKIIQKFKNKTACKYLLILNDPTCEGSIHNVMIEYENREITSEPLSIIAADNPITCDLF